MIFVTIGTQEPFDRLIKAMDKIASDINVEVISQVSLKSQFQAKNMKTFNFLAPAEFEKIFNDADLIVAHAGMGTIISALVNQKPLIVLPRELKLQEHRSDHQMATVKYLSALGYLNVAKDVEDLEKLVLNFISNNEIGVFPKIGKHASVILLDSIRNVGRKNK